MTNDDSRLPCIISSEAEADLTALIAYIAGDRIDASIRMLHRLEDAIVRLRESPQIGHVRDDVPGVRLWTVRPYVIIYRIKDERVEILRVAHGAREFPRISSG